MKSVPIRNNGSRFVNSGASGVQGSVTKVVAHQIKRSSSTHTV